MLIAGVAVLSASLTSLFLTPDRDEPAGPHAQAPSREEPRTVVMPNAPEESKPAAPIPAAPALPNAADEDRGLTRNASRSDEDDDQREEAAPRNTNETRSKPQRVVRREPERKPVARPAPPRRRPTPQPAPRNDEDAADWEINLASKASGQKQPNFEVGSNNAPILD